VLFAYTQTFSVKVCKYANNILFYSQNFKDRSKKELPAYNIAYGYRLVLLIQ